MLPPLVRGGVEKIERRVRSRAVRRAGGGAAGQSTGIEDDRLGAGPGVFAHRRAAIFRTRSTLARAVGAIKGNW
jgi:hypothetical protein